MRPDRTELMRRAFAARLGHVVQEQTGGRLAAVPESEDGMTERSEPPSARLLDGLRAQLGLPPDAGEDVILAANAEALEERADAPIPPMALDEVTRLSTENLQMKAELAGQRRKALFAEWQRTGRIAPAERTQIEAMYDGAPEATVALISARKEGSAVPINEIGHSEDSDLSEPDALYAAMGTLRGETS